MRTRVTSALASAALGLTPGAANAAEALVDVRATSLPALPGLEATGHGRTGWIGAVADDRALAALRRAGIPVRVRVADLAARERADRAADAAFAARGPSDLPSGRSDYRRLADYESDMRRLVDERPDLVAPIELSPPSLEGRTIRGIEITHDVGRVDGKPVLLMVGLHHAREWPSGEHSIEFAFDLVRGDGRDRRITRLLERARVIVVPVVNPDGFHASRSASVDTDDPNAGLVIGIPGNGSAYRRKNCRATAQSGHTQPAVPCDLTPGVDLNRNYGIHWGANGASTFEQAPDYRGAFPFSEPETEAIRRLVVRRPVTMLITNHTFGNQVLRPPGLRSVGTVPDEPALKAIADRMAEANGYVSERSWELYDNSGTTEDWSYGVTGGFGYTFEINPENFHPPYERAVVDEYLGAGPTAGKGNREAYLRALRAAADRRHHAVVEGFAPPGRVLRMRRAVDWQTGPVCIVQPTGFFSTPCGPTTDPMPGSDALEVRRVVGDDGVVAWHVNASQSPLALRSGAWELTCETQDGEVLERRTVALARGETARVRLRCGEPPCDASRALRRVSVSPGRGVARVRIGLRAGARDARLRVLRVAAGSRGLRPRPVATPPVRGGRATWRAPGRATGAYVLEVAARAAGGQTDVRRRALLVSAGTIRVGPRFARARACGELRDVRLESPLIARRGRRPALILRPRFELRARVVMRVAGRVAATRRAALARGRRQRIALPRVRGERVAVEVRTVRGTRAARRRSAVSVFAAGAYDGGRP